MKQKLLLVIGAIIISVALTAGIMDPDGKAGYTGSPLETTCNTTGCHNSFALNSGDGSITATSTMNNWVYEPLATYTISIKVAKPSVHLFGFGVEILSSANTNAGTILVTDATKTRIKQRVVNGVTRRNIVHNTNGGASQDSAIFTFNWTAPDTTVGVITLYFAGNAANSNGAQTGDYIYNNVQTITPTSGNTVPVLLSSNSFSIYPNPAHAFITMHYFLPREENVCVKLYDLKSSVSYLLMNNVRSAGENNEILSLPADCKSDLYFLSIESDFGHITRKLIIN